MSPQKAVFMRKLAQDLLMMGNDCVGDVVRSSVLNSPNAFTPTRRNILPSGCDMASKRSGIARAGHELVRLQPYRGKWNGHSFPQIRTQYSKCSCAMKCGTPTRTFCSCDFSLMLCGQCYGEHLAALNKL